MEQHQRSETSNSIIKMRLEERLSKLQTQVVLDMFALASGVVEAKNNCTGLRVELYNLDNGVGSELGWNIDNSKSMDRLKVILEAIFDGIKNFEDRLKKVFGKAPIKCDEVVKLDIGDKLRKSNHDLVTLVSDFHETPVADGYDYTLNLEKSLNGLSDRIEDLVRENKEICSARAKLKRLSSRDLLNPGSEVVHGTMFPEDRSDGVSVQLSKDFIKQIAAESGVTEEKCLEMFGIKVDDGIKSTECCVIL